MASWFYRDARFTNEQYQIPDLVLTSRCPEASLRTAREQFHRAATATNVEQKRAAEVAAVGILDECRESFREEKPIQYYLISPLRVMKRLFVHAGPVLPLPAVRSLRAQHSVLLLFKLWAVFFYWLALASGVLGLLLAAKKPRRETLAVAFPVVFVALFFAFGIRNSERRMLVVAFPFLCILGATAFTELTDALVRRFSWSRNRQSYFTA
jgi:hypothetical protein